jgi:POT family proton-dependent oligopeptide transporter
MILGLIFYQIFRPKYLQGIGLPPDDNAGGGQGPEMASSVHQPMTSVDWQRICVVLVLAFLGNIFFWTAFEQAGSSMNVFAKDKTDRTVGGLITGFGSDGEGEKEDASTERGFPASWYQSVNPLGILVFGPVFAWLWVWLDRRKLNPSTPMKFAWGLYFLGLAFLAMVAAAFESQKGELAGAHWLLITYVVVTWGELCLSPVGLSMITKLAPPKLQSLMMGVWFFSFSLSNLFAGLVAAFSKRLEDGTWTFVYPGLPGFFLMLVVFPIGAGIVLTLLTPVLKRMMHGVH